MARANWYASPLLRWPHEVKNLETKLRVAERIAALAADGDCIGIGSGSATYLSLWAIGQRARAEGLALSVITSSYETDVAAATLGLPRRRLGEAIPAWSVDGADEVDPDGRVLKGRGGALFREKMLWAASKRMILAIDSGKRVDRLGSGFPLPVEVHPDAVSLVAAFVQRHGAHDAVLRIGSGKDGPVITELGCLLLDVQFDEIPHGIHAELKQIPGVIETGLFEGYEFEVADES
jgi:ribose 5-phosphate isomerase A